MRCMTRREKWVTHGLTIMVYSLNDCTMLDEPSCSLDVFDNVQWRIIVTVCYIDVPAYSIHRYRHKNSVCIFVSDQTYRVIGAWRRR